MFDGIQQGSSFSQAEMGRVNSFWRIVWGIMGIAALTCIPTVYAIAIAIFGNSKFPDRDSPSIAIGTIGYFITIFGIVVLFTGISKGYQTTKSDQADIDENKR